MHPHRTSRTCRRSEITRSAAQSARKDAPVTAGPDNRRQNGVLELARGLDAEAVRRAQDDIRALLEEALRRMAREGRHGRAIGPWSCYARRRARNGRRSLSRPSCRSRMARSKRRHGETCSEIERDLAGAHPSGYRSPQSWKRMYSGLMLGVGLRCRIGASRLSTTYGGQQRLGASLRQERRLPSQSCSSRDRPYPGVHPRRARAISPELAGPYRCPAARSGRISFRRDPSRRLASGVAHDFACLPPTAEASRLSIAFGSTPDRRRGPYSRCGGSMPPGRAFFEMEEPP